MFSKFMNRSFPAVGTEGGHRHRPGTAALVMVRVVQVGGRVDAIDRGQRGVTEGLEGSGGINFMTLGTRLNVYYILQGGKGRIMRYNTNEYREITDIIIPEGEN